MANPPKITPLTPTPPTPSASARARAAESAVLSALERGEAFSDRIARDITFLILTLQNTLPTNTPDYAALVPSLVFGLKSVRGYILEITDDLPTTLQVASVVSSIKSVDLSEQIQAGLGSVIHDSLGELREIMQAVADAILSGKTPDLVDMRTLRENMSLMFTNINAELSTRLGWDRTLAAHSSVKTLPNFLGVLPDDVKSEVLRDSERDGYGTPENELDNS